MGFRELAAADELEDEKEVKKKEDNDAAHDDLGPAFGIIYHPRRVDDLRNTLMRQVSCGGIDNPHVCCHIVTSDGVRRGLDVGSVGQRIVMRVGA